MKIILLTIAVNQFVLCQMNKASRVDERESDSLSVSTQEGYASFQLMLLASIIMTATLLATEKNPCGNRNIRRRGAGSFFS